MALRKNTKHPNIKQYEDGKYYYRGTLSGRRVEEPLNTSRWVRAVEEARKLEAAFNENDQQGADLYVSDVVPIFLEDTAVRIKEEGLSLHSYEEYERIFRLHLTPFYKFNKMVELNPESNRQSKLSKIWRGGHLWRRYKESKPDLDLGNHKKVFEIGRASCRERVYVLV